MKNILFVCTGNSARSIIAESIINNEYDDMYKGFSAGSNPTGKVNEDVKNYLLSKHYDLSNYRSKNFNEFINLSLIHICRCRRSTLCRSRWSPYH